MARKSTGVIHHVGTFLLFCSFVLLLVASISSPVINSISLLKVDLTQSSSNVAGRPSQITYGSFGYCKLNVHSSSGNQDQCSKSQIGYSIAKIQTSEDNTDFSNASTKTLDGLTNVMVLHPVGAAIAFIAFVFAAGAGFCGSLIGSLIAFVAWIVVFVAMVIDFIVMGTVKDHVNSGNKGTGSHARFGVAMWLVLAAFICLFFATIITFLSCCSGRRERRSNRTATKEVHTTTRTHRKKRFGLF